MAADDAAWAWLDGRDAHPPIAVCDGVDVARWRGGTTASVVISAVQHMNCGVAAAPLQYGTLVGFSDAETVWIRAQLLRQCGIAHIDNVERCGNGACVKHNDSMHAAMTLLTLEYGKRLRNGTSGSRGFIVARHACAPSDGHFGRSTCSALMNFALLAAHCRREFLVVDDSRAVMGAPVGILASRRDNWKLTAQQRRYIRLYAPSALSPLPLPLPSSRGPCLRLDDACPTLSWTEARHRLMTAAARLRVVAVLTLCLGNVDGSGARHRVAACSWWALPVELVHYVLAAGMDVMDRCA